MSISERDAVLRERAAFEHGFRLARGGVGLVLYAPHEAARVYPLPKVTRPRVLKDPEGNYEYRITGDGEVQFRHTSDIGEWIDLTGAPMWVGNMTVARVRVWADLLANPTEEVEA